MANTLRFGLIGSGNMARKRAQQLRRLDDIDLVAVAARNPETGPALAREHGVPLLADWRELVAENQIDAILSTTHNALHGEILLAALDAGKPVYSEYPACRTVAELKELLHRLESGRTPNWRLAHRPALSREHAALREAVQSRGNLMLAQFIRFTPGRGMRPEVLFNLDQSGPPALFFVYHVHPRVDLFGSAAWVESASRYENLRDDGGYDRFINTVTVGFVRGGIGQWTWAGGAVVKQARESESLLFTDGSLFEQGEGWIDGLTGEALPHPPAEPDLEDRLLQQFVTETREGSADDWIPDARTGLQAAAVGLAAEISARENRRVLMDELMG